MKNQTRFTHNIHIEGVCNLEVSGVAYRLPDKHEWEDNFSWVVEVIRIDGVLLNGAMFRFAMHTYSNKIDKRLELVIDTFFEDDEEDLTTDMRQDMPDIFGRLTDLNPEYGC